MKIYRPLWEDGAFLAPQQFQQQARWDAHVADTVARMALAHPWGVLCAEFDEGALALSRLNATRLCVRFADGTLVDTDLADNLPPVADLSAVGSDAVEVLLCLPLLSANGGNLDDGQDSARPRRWQSERVTVQELAGHERSELTVLRHALTLRLSTQENSAWLTCPVARLMRNAQGQWVLERSFIPPLLSLSASPLLLSELSDLLHRLAARRKRLMAMRRESNERMRTSRWLLIKEASIASARKTKLIPPASRIFCIRRLMPWRRGRYGSNTSGSGSKSGAKTGFGQSVVIPAICCCQRLSSVAAIGVRQIPAAQRFSCGSGAYAGG